MVVSEVLSVVAGVARVVVSGGPPPVPVMVPELPRSRRTAPSSLTAPEPALLVLTVSVSVSVSGSGAEVVKGLGLPSAGVASVEEDVDSGAFPGARRAPSTVS